MWGAFSLFWGLGAVWRLRWEAWSFYGMSEMLPSNRRFILFQFVMIWCLCVLCFLDTEVNPSYIIYSLSVFVNYVISTKFLFLSILLRYPIRINNVNVGCSCSKLSALKYSTIIRSILRSCKSWFLFFLSIVSSLKKNLFLYFQMTPSEAFWAELTFALSFWETEKPVQHAKSSSSGSGSNIASRASSVLRSAVDLFNLDVFNK